MYGDLGLQSDDMRWSDCNPWINHARLSTSIRIITDTACIPACSTALRHHPRDHADTQHTDSCHTRPVCCIFTHHVLPTTSSGHVEHYCCLRTESKMRVTFETTVL